jgi:hypothetical protein
MEKMEDLLTAIDPLVLAEFGISGHRYYLRPFIRYDITQNIVYVLFSPFGGRGSILLHSDMNKNHAVYYCLWPEGSSTSVKIYESILNCQDIIKENTGIIFSGKNVFSYLHLGDLYETSPGESLVDIHAICLRIKENKHITDSAFSDEKIEDAYKALSTMGGNNEEEINRVLKTLFSH